MARIRDFSPDTFGDIVGAANAGAVREIQEAARSRAGLRALLLGPPGSGKTVTARLLMKSFCCAAPDPVTADPCGRCDGCVRHGIEFSGEFHVGRHWETNCAGAVGKNELDDLVAEACDDDKPRLFFDELHRLSKAAQASLLTFGQDTPGAVLVAAAAYDHASATAGPLSVIPELFQRLRRLYLFAPTTTEMVEFLRRKVEGWGVAAPEPLLRELVTRSGRSFRGCLDRLDAAAATPSRTLTVELIDNTFPPAEETSREIPTSLW